MLSAFKNIYAKEDVKKEHPVSLLGDSGVVEEDIIKVIPKFSCWCESNPDANIIEFFCKRNMNARVIKALAVVGLKTCIDELNSAVTKKEKKSKKESKEESK